MHALLRTFFIPQGLCMLIIPTEKTFDWSNIPIVLIVIVLLNTSIYLGYQTRDSAKIDTILKTYVEAGYTDTEWSHYNDYINAQKKASPEQAQNLDLQFNHIKDYVSNNNSLAVSYALLRDPGFSQYIHTHFGRHAQPSETKLEFSNYQEMLKDRDTNKTWLSTRDEARQILLSTSALRFGLIPNQTSIITLISHSFLHADIIHLISNMFFLLICGFAVEAAIGHLKFLGFYLLSGLGGGLLHLWVNIDSDVPLVGASGAISGVMAMYLAVFRLRKIEFFYWFFIIVGYFRAPALFILPFYIGTEIYNYYTTPHSTTAFMAHIGGFIVGAASILITPKFIPNVIDKEYVEKDQSTPPEQISLSHIYSAIESYQFTLAYKRLNEHRHEFGRSTHIDILRFNIIIKLDAKNALAAGLSVLKNTNIERRFLNKIIDICETKQNPTKYLSLPDLMHLSSEFIRPKPTAQHIKHAESLFLQAQKRTQKNPAQNTPNKDDLEQLSILAGKLSHYFKQKRNSKKYEFYQNCIEQCNEN